MKTFLTISCSLLVAATAHAGVTIVTNEYRDAPGGAINSSNYGNFDASGTEKLIILVAAGRDRSASQGISSVTYNGTTLTNAVVASSVSITPGEATGVFYLDAPGAAGDIIVNYAGKAWGPRCSINILTVNGLLAGHDVTATDTGGASLALTTGNNTSFVVALARGHDPATETPQAPLVDLSATRHGAGYQIASPTTMITPTFAAGECAAACAFFVNEPSAGTLFIVR